MTGLQDVPVEVILHVIEILSRKARGPRSLRSLCLVSHGLKELAQPFLYHDATVECSPHILSFLYGSKDSRKDKQRRLRQFLRTIILRPELGTHVRDLVLVGAGGRASEYSLTEEISSISLHVAHKDAEEREDPGLPDKERHPKLYRQAHRDLVEISGAAAKAGLPSGFVYLPGSNGLIILLLHFLPNLNFLALHANNTVETIACASLDCLPGGVPSGLRSVRDIRMMCDSEKVSPLSRHMYAAQGLIMLAHMFINPVDCRMATTPPRSSHS